MICSNWFFSMKNYLSIILFFLVWVWRYFMLQWLKKEILKRENVLLSGYMTHPTRKYCNNKKHFVLVDNRFDIFTIFQIANFINLLIQFTFVLHCNTLTFFKVLAIKCDFVFKTRFHRNFFLTLTHIMLSQIIQVSTKSMFFADTWIVHSKFVPTLYL